MTDPSGTNGPGRPNDLVKWLIVAAIPALAWVVGAVALPRPRALADEKQATDRASLGAAVSRTRPTPKMPVTAVLGDAIRVLGADLPEAALSRGSRLSARFHYEAITGLDRDWQVFLHIDAKGASYRIHGDHFPVGGRYNTTLWQPGDFIADDWSTIVPRDAPAGVYDVWLGFYVGDERLDWTEGTPSAHDGTDRVRVGAIVIE